MKLLDTLERKLARFAIPNVTVFIVMLQAAAYVLTQVQPRGGSMLVELILIGNRVFAGEWWRLVAFIFLPPGTNAIFAFFALYFFYLMGTALEGYWGTFRYNCFLLIGYASTIAAALLIPDLPATNLYVEGSVFLAFAFLYPDFQIYLMFLLPVKIKWVALITWIGLGWTFIGGTALDRALLILSVLNFLLFFGRPLLLRARQGAKHMSEQAETLASRTKPFHVCAACGITDKTHPKMEFRYCPDCAGTPGYCIDHILNHTHRTEPAATTAP